MSLFHDTNSLKKILQKNPDCYRPLYDTSMGRKLKRLFILLLKQALFDQDTFLPMGKNNYMYFIKDVLTMDVAIPLAAGVLYTYGIILNPALGAGLMSLSTVIVAVNARLLKLDK